MILEEWFAGHAYEGIWQFCRLQGEGQRLMRAVTTQLNLSAQAHHRILILKLARTIADLTGCEKI